MPWEPSTITARLCLQLAGSFPFVPLVAGGQGPGSFVYRFWMWSYIVISRFFKITPFVFLIWQSAGIASVLFHGFVLPLDDPVCYGNMVRQPQFALSPFSFLVAIGISVMFLHSIVSQFPQPYFWFLSVIHCLLLHFL